jgi:hypothetical protein
VALSIGIQWRIASEYADIAHHHQGRDHIVASTEGNVTIDGHEETKVGVNIYHKK